MKIWIPVPRWLGRALGRIFGDGDLEIQLEYIILLVVLAFWAWMMVHPPPPEKPMRDPHMRVA